MSKWTVSLLSAGESIVCVRLDGQSAASIDFCFFVFVNNVTKYRIITTVLHSLGHSLCSSVCVSAVVGARGVVSLI